MIFNSKPQPPIIIENPAPPRLNFTSIEAAFGYIVGYCNKHIRCSELCRLYDIEEDRCMFYDASAGMPCDWKLLKRLLKNAKKNFAKNMRRVIGI